MTRTKAPVPSPPLSVTEAAEYLRLSRRTLERITSEAGQGHSAIPVVRIRSRRFFLQADLDAFLQQHRHS